jgi:hypothetical protein
MKAAPNSLRCGTTEWHLAHVTSYWWAKIGMARAGAGRAAKAAKASSKGTRDGTKRVNAISN